ncbi:MAG TPA: hypothetical protein VFK31_02575 [Rhodanobacteraceae bacterium]|nr:hypothetical protein [Rhodanobacteraceae bacterium]
MNGFLWAYGHLGWGIFAVAVFTGLWWLLGDVVWRLKNIGIGRFVAVMFPGWIIGVGLIVLGFFLGSR